MASSILPAFDVLESRVLRVPAGDVYENMEEMGSTSRGHYGSTSSQSSVPDPPSAYVDPFLSVWELLWYINGINDLVKGALEKMEKGVFAYNSIFFLKVVLDLQAAYLPLRPPPPSHAVIEFRLVVRIAEVISGRLARRDKETNSLSRELQLRTLVAALSLLDQYDGSKVENDIYVRLLQDVSEMDWDNRDKYINHQKVGGLGSGNYEYLVRYACDLVRKVPSDNPMPPMPTLNSQGIHFLLAAGFVVSTSGLHCVCVKKKLLIVLGNEEPTKGRAPVQCHGTDLHKNIDTSVCMA